MHVVVLFWIAWGTLAAANCSGGTCLRDESDSPNYLLTYARLNRTRDRAATALPHGSAVCIDGENKRQGPSAVHAVWSTDLGQIEGLQASIASAVDTARGPLVLHVMMESGLVQDFEKRLGFQSGCRSILLGGRVPLHLREIDEELVRPAVPKVSKEILKKRGRIDSTANFARFYMHRLVPDANVVIYLDADTIVQQDLATLRDEFVKTKKTIAFAARRHQKLQLQETLSFTLHPGNPCHMCDDDGDAWDRMRRRPAYNAGVYAVDLERWAERRMSERIEALVARNNACDPGIWRGGSQAGLLLAIYTEEDGRERDLAVLDKTWNFLDLGWSSGVKEERLRRGRILHWNGKGKPWAAYGHGHFQDFWLPFRERYDALAGRPSTFAFPERGEAAAA